MSEERMVSNDQVEEFNEELFDSFAELRAQRKAIQSAKTHDLDIPGYNGRLVARYTMLGFDRVNKIQTRSINILKDTTAQMNAQIDTLIAALEQVCARKNDGSVVPIDDEHPIRFDKRLAALFGFEAESARDVVKGVFVHEMYIVDQHQDLIMWMRGMTSDVELEALGESDGLPT